MYHNWRRPHFVVHIAPTVACTRMFWHLYVATQCGLAISVLWLRLCDLPLALIFKVCANYRRNGCALFYKAKLPTCSTGRTRCSLQGLPSPDIERLLRFHWTPSLCMSNIESPLYTVTSRHISTSGHNLWRHRHQCSISRPYMYLESNQISQTFAKYSAATWWRRQSSAQKCPDRQQKLINVLLFKPSFIYARSFLRNDASGAKAKTHKYKYTIIVDLYVGKEVAMP